MARRKKDDEHKTHNQGQQDAARIEAAAFILDANEKIRKLKDGIKEKKNWAKDNFGILKTGLTKAVKELEKTEDKHQADKEVIAERDRIIELVANKYGQYSFLLDEAA